MTLGMLCGVILPLLILVAAVASAVRGVDAMDAVSHGAMTGLRVAAGILPGLVGLLVGVYMLRASGLLAVFSDGAGRLLSRVGLPGEIAPLLVVRPFSGSGAIATAAELMETHGPDSLVGRLAAVILGSSETTLYTANVCLNAAGVRRSRWALPVAMVTELAACGASAAAVLLMWG